MGQHCCSYSETLLRPGHLYSLRTDGSELLEYDLDSRRLCIHSFADSPVPMQAKYCLLNEQVFIVGGRSRMSRKATAVNESSAVSFLFTGGALKLKAHLVLARQAHGLVAYEQFVYAISGSLEGHKASKTCECYNADVDCWELMPSLAVPRLHSGVCCSRHRVYVTGGNSGASLECVRTIEVFDVLLNSWTVLDLRLPVSVWRHACAAYEGGIAIFGGSSTAGKQCTDCFLISVNTRRITQVPGLVQGYYLSPVVQVRGKDVFALDDNGWLISFEHGRWTTSPLGHT